MYDYKRARLPSAQQPHDRITCLCYFCTWDAATQSRSRFLSDLLASKSTTPIQPLALCSTRVIVQGNSTVEKLGCQAEIMLAEEAHATSARCEMSSPARVVVSCAVLCLPPLYYVAKAVRRALQKQQIVAGCMRCRPLPLMSDVWGAHVYGIRVHVNIVRKNSVTRAHECVEGWRA